MEFGAEALTVRRISAVAGCSTMGLYSRFGGKEGLVDHLFREGFVGLGEAMDAVNPDLPALSALRVCGRAYRSYALAHTSHYHVMFTGAVPGFQPSSESQAVAHGTFERLVSNVTRAQAEGVMRADVAPDVIAEVVWATIHGFVMLELVGMDKASCSPSELYELVLDQIVRGWAP